MNKLSNLLDWFNNKNSVLVSLSGGVDSALVAYAAFQKLGGRSFAVTADYKTLAKEELDTSKNIADEIGMAGVKSITEAGLSLSLRCPLTGEYNVGNNWAETH